MFMLSSVIRDNTSCKLVVSTQLFYYNSAAHMFGNFAAAVVLNAAPAANIHVTILQILIVRTSVYAVANILCVCVCVCR